jgi:ABC-2 type transport system permease protein
VTSSGPRTPGSAALVRLVAAREVSSRIRDKNFVISSVVILLLLLGTMAFQVVVSSGEDTSRVAVAADDGRIGPAVEAQGEAVGVDVEVVDVPDEAAARDAVETEEVDAALVDGTGPAPELLLVDRDPTLEAVVGGAVSGLAVSDRLLEAGVDLQSLPEVAVTPVGDEGEDDGQRVVVAIMGVVVLYGLLILFAQFVAQGVVEEKASRVVELLLATMRPWQLLAGKILGLGLLGLGQIVVIGAVGVAGALTFDLVDVPGQLIGTVATVVAWFVLGYAFYAAAYACAGALVPRQEELQSATTPLNMVILISYFVAFAALQNPDGTLARVASFIPITAPVTMPPRIALGAATPLEVVGALVVTAGSAALLVPLAARIYRGAVLRTGSAVKLREAWRAARA